MLLDDMRKTLEATLGNCSRPPRRRNWRKDLMEPGAAKEQIAKTAADLMEWSQGNRERLTTFIREEIPNQMKNVGVATRVGPGCGEEAGPRTRARRGHDRLGSLGEEGHDPEALHRAEAHREEVSRQEEHRRARPTDDTARRPSALGRDGSGWTSTGRRSPASPGASATVTRRRLDTELVRRGLAASRAEAQEAVRAGLVLVVGVPGHQGGHHGRRRCSR